MKKFSNVKRNERPRRQSSGSDDCFENPPQNRRILQREPFKRVLFDENTDPNGRMGRPPRWQQVAPAKDLRGKRCHDDSSGEDRRPTKKATQLRRALKISSAAALRFERGFPSALRVSLENSSTAYSKSKKIGDGSCSDNDAILNMKEVCRHLNVQDEKLDALKAMLAAILEEKTSKKPAPSSSDCKIVACYRSPPAAAGNPKSAPSSAERRRVVESPISVDHTMMIDASDFMVWIREASTGLNGRQTLMLPSAVVRSGDYMWFRELMEDRISLRDEHMDVLINWMVVKYDMEITARDWTVMEIWCWGALTQDDFQQCEENLMPYVHGSYPLNNGRAWHTVERVYGFGYVDEHWVGFEIEFLNQRITVVDSLHLGRKRLGRYFEPMRYHIPRLCEIQGVWEKKKYPEAMRECWDVVYCSETPTQSPHDKTNCGILLMKMLEAMARGDPISRINADKCAMYRLRYCVDLHEHSVLFSGNDI